MELKFSKIHRGGQTEVSRRVSPISYATPQSSMAADLLDRLLMRQDLADHE
jgi:hypothetical protein